MGVPHGIPVPNQPSQAPLGREPFGWMKTVGGLRKVKLRGRENLWWLFTFTAAAFNLWRLPKLRAGVC